MIYCFVDLTISLLSLYLVLFSSPPASLYRSLSTTSFLHPSSISILSSRDSTDQSVQFAVTFWWEDLLSWISVSSTSSPRFLRLGLITGQGIFLLRMFSSRPAVHPVEAPPPTVTTENPPRVRMKDIQGMPGTPGGLALRFFQFMFAVAALGVMASTSDFTSVTAFCYLVAAAILQSLWSLSLAILDVYALLVKRSLRNPRVNCLFAIGDGITSTLTFAAACASAGITVLIGNDLNICSQNHCASFETATAMAFISWFAMSPSFLLNFWSLASA